MTVLSRARLMAGALMLMALAGSPAIAQQQLAMDESFRASAEGLAGQLARSDAGSAVPVAQQLVRAADKPGEKYVAGQILLQASAARSDLPSQRMALNAILESGMVPETERGKLHSLAGVLSVMLGDMKDGMAQIQYANRIGHATVTSQIALADAAYALNQPDTGSAALQQAITLRLAAGQVVDEHWYDRGIALSYRAGRPDLVASLTQAKLANMASTTHWRSGIINYLGVAKAGLEQTLDLYRLMAATGSLASERDWLAYADIAQKSGTAVEAKAAIDAGLASGRLSASDALVRKALARMLPLATRALGSLDSEMRKAEASSDGAVAMNAADHFFAAARYAEAAKLYTLALERNGGDRQRAMVRRGIAYARSGDMPAGKTALATVTEGDWAPVAGFWSTWIEKQTGN